MSELDEQDKRIEQILGRFDMDVSEESSLKYMDYLKGNIEFPCQVCGIEDFRWEEYYVFGPGSKKEYEANTIANQPGKKRAHPIVLL